MAARQVDELNQVWTGPASITGGVDTRNPRRWRNIALGFFISGVVTVPAAFLLPIVAAHDTLRAIIVCYGAMALLFGGGSAFFRHSDLRAEEALSRGEDVLARWHVDAAAWRAFIAFDRQLNQEQRALVNELSVRDPNSESGIDVIVGKDAVQVDDSIHTLPWHGTPEITRTELNTGAAGPSYIAFELYYPGGGHGASGAPRSAHRAVLRFPVATGAFMDAKRAVDYYAGGRPGKPDFFHGLGDGADPEDLSECLVCGYKTHQYLSHCPQCGAGLQTRRWSRRLGAILFLSGSVILAIMGVVTYYTAPLLLHPDVSIHGATFSGTPGQAAFVLGIFGVVIIFGFTALCYGAFQVITGRRRKRVMCLILCLWAMLGLLAYVI